MIVGQNGHNTPSHEGGAHPQIIMCLYIYIYITLLFHCTPLRSINLCASREPVFHDSCSSLYMVQYTSSPIGQTSPILFGLRVLFGFREFQQSKAVISRNSQNMNASDKFEKENSFT